MFAPEINNKKQEPAGGKVPAFYSFLSTALHIKHQDVNCTAYKTPAYKTPGCDHMVINTLIM